MILHRTVRLALLLVTGLVAIAPPARAQAIATPTATEYEGAAALGLALRRLGTTKRVLMIAAHPDDESTQILSTFALGQGADVAYLSLTRGEGGQNGIGPELQEPLGLLRTEELLAARRLDGAQQFFTRAYDFGFSKSAGEAFRHWPRDSLLADVVSVVRRFRPDVVVSIFSGTPRDGHGQHQAAGILAREAFAAAGDPARFPDQIARGLQPYAPPKLFQALWRDMDEVDVDLPTGERDPLLGRSYYQVAMASRSRHRSQDMGRPLTPGPQSSGFALIESRVPVPADATSLFAGIDTTLVARGPGPAGTNGSGTNGSGADIPLATYQRRVLGFRDGARLLSPDALVTELADLFGPLQQVEAAAARLPDEEARQLRFRIAQEEEDLRDALALAAGLTLDAVADDETVVPGQTFELDLSLWNGGSREVTVRSVAPHLPEGWRAEPLDALPPMLSAGSLLTRRFRVTVPEGAAATEPYYLREPRAGDLYRWPGDISLDGLPFEPSGITAQAEVEIEGVRLPIEDVATFRGLDKMQGEFRRPVRVVPAVSVRIEPQVALVPLAGTEGLHPTTDPVRFTVRLAAEAPDGVNGTLQLQLPPGYRAEPASAPLRFQGSGEERAVEFSVFLPRAMTRGTVPVGAVFETDAGTRYERGFELVDYPHIQPRALYRTATARINAFPVQVPEGLRVGYIEGAGDAVPAALQQLGIEPQLLYPTALAEDDLSRFDVIVTGIRAYEVRPDLVANNRRLLDYVREGGTLIVQYNKYEFEEEGIAPFPVTMARPHDRLTDETAPVRLLNPAHPVFSTPNRITDADFDGWIQERGLYFLHEWDSRYTPLLELNDPGETPLRGGLLVAPYGQGTYVYTGLAFFRQLPAGVPGAYRLFANLLALGAGQ